MPTLPTRVDTAHAAPALAETAAPDPATPAAGGGGKINSNRAQPTDVQTAYPSPPVDPDSDVTLGASFLGSDGDSDYVESSENSPTSHGQHAGPCGAHQQTGGGARGLRRRYWCHFPTNCAFIPHRRALNSGSRQRRDRPTQKPPRQWHHAAGQYPAIPAALTLGRHVGCISQATTMPPRQG